MENVKHHAGNSSCQWVGTPRLKYPLLSLILTLLSVLTISPLTHAARNTLHAIRNTPHASFRQRIAAALNTPDFKHALVGCLVVRARDRQLIYEQNADTLLMPASNMKLLTSATALDVLGGDFRCRTVVRAQTIIAAEGTLAGDLFLVGSGDPALTYDDLKKLAQSLWDKGLRKVEGCVVGDESAFQGASLGFGWQWDDLPWYYSMEVSALSLGRNQVNVVVKPGEKVGEAAVVTVEPANGYVVVENTATTGDEKARNTISFDRELGGKCIKVKGVLPLKAPPSSQRCSVWQPCLYTATVFTETLKAQGIEVKGAPKTGVAPKDSVELAAHASPPLRDIVKQMNKPSDNHTAEQLLRLIGIQHKGQGTDAAGAEAIRAFLLRCGADEGSVRVADGSGLSRFNLVTPRTLARLLLKMRLHPESQAFFDSLPIAGVDGTLRLRMRNTPAEKKVFAKTGSLLSVSSLSGYVHASSGEVYVVVLMFNHYLCPASVVRAAQDKVCQILAEA